MAVPAEIALATLQEELDCARALARELYWGIILRPSKLAVNVTMFAHNRDPFILDVRFDGYKALPPAFEFIDPVTGEPRTRHAYPKAKVPSGGSDSFFNESCLCICAPFNRKAYKVFDERAPHADWPLDENWTKSKAQGFDWSTLSMFGDMLAAIHTRLIDPNRYAGRMG